MKRLFFLSFLLLTSLLSYSQFVVQVRYVIVNGEAVVSIQDKDLAGDIVISETITHEGKEYKVTSIVNSAFQGCMAINSVKIPESVSIIGESAFRNCINLTSISLPNSIYSISDYLLYGCTGLTTVTIPNSVTSIGNEAFSGCTGLTSVTIPNSVTSIGNEAFSGCTGLTSVTIPNSVTSIGNAVFYNCMELKSIVFPEGLTKISDRICFGCGKLESVTIPDKVIAIGYDAFSCTGLKSIIIPNSVETISNSLSHNYYLKDVFIGSNVKDIYRGSFEQTELKKIQVSEDNPYFDSRDSCNAIVETATNTIIKGAGIPNFPKSVTKIGGEAYMENQDIIDLEIPEWIDSIGWGAFQVCQQMKSLTIKGNIAEIPYFAFSTDVRLHTVKILGNIGNFGESTFGSCTDLKKFYCMSDVVPILYDNPSSWTSTFGYSFSYMRDEDKIDTLYVRENMIDTYKASGGWNVAFKNILPAYMIYYNVDGELYDKNCYAEGEEIDYPSFEKEGYTFLWSEFPKTMPANDLTLTGSFTINKYKLTYMVDGEEYKSYDVEYGATITPEPAPTKEGYTFSGWGDIPETMPAHDVVVYASFTSGIDDIFNNKQKARIFSIDGKPLNDSQKGINIIRFSNGETRKVIR